MNCLSGETMSISIGWYSKPGASVGTMNSAGLSWPVFASSVRPTTMTASASSTPEMNTFRPLRTQPSPSRRAVVVILCELEPASGSVMANAMRSEPSAKPRQPALLLLVGAEPGDDRARRSPARPPSAAAPQPAAASSSHTAARSPMPPPPPPYSSGTFTPR